MTAAARIHFHDYPLEVNETCKDCDAEQSNNSALFSSDQFLGLILVNQPCKSTNVILRKEGILNPEVLGKTFASCTSVARDDYFSNPFGSLNKA